MSRDREDREKRLTETLGLEDTRGTATILLPAAAQETAEYGREWILKKKQDLMKMYKQATLSRLKELCVTAKITYVNKEQAAEAYAEYLAGVARRGRGP